MLGHGAPGDAPASNSSRPSLAFPCGMNAASACAMARLAISCIFAACGSAMNGPSSSGRPQSHGAEGLRRFAGELQGADFAVPEDFCDRGVDGMLPQGHRAQFLRLVGIERREVPAAACQ